LALLSDDKVRALVSLADRESQRVHVYSVLGMSCGFMSFLAALGVCAYLVMHGHVAEAAVFFGTSMVAVVTQMIRGRDA
jgi:hypothetical protein